MKKLVLFTLTLTCAPTYTYKPPVQGALYAELRAVPDLDGCLRVYKGAEAMHPVCHTIEYTCPTLCFFDKDGNELLQEQFTDWQNNDRPKGAAIWDIQQRLTCLPKAHNAKVVWFKLPDGAGEYFILLFDKDGAQIALLTCPTILFGIPKTGDPIPEDFIDGFTNWIENPDTLESLKIIDCIEIPYDFTEEEYLTKYYPRLKACS